MNDDCGLSQPDAETLPRTYALENFIAITMTKSTIRKIAIIIEFVERRDD